MFKQPQETARALVSVECTREQTFRTSSAEDDGVDRNAFRLLPVGVDGRTLAGGSAESRVRVRGSLVRVCQTKRAHKRHERRRVLVSVGKLFAVGYRAVMKLGSHFEVYLFRFLLLKVD